MNGHFFLLSDCLSCPQFLLYSCPLSSISYCAVLPSSPKVFGFVAKHPAADMYHCYLFQSKKFVSIPSTAFTKTYSHNSLKE